jgi:hypothetical protein
MLNNLALRCYLCGARATDRFFFSHMVLDFMFGIIAEVFDWERYFWE